MICTSFPHKHSCALGVTHNSLLLPGLIKNPAFPISLILPPLISPVHTPSPCSLSSPKSISLPSESKGLSRQLVTTLLPTLLSQHRGYHALRTKHRLPPQPPFLLPGYPLTTPLLFPANSSGCSLLTPPTSVFSLCNSPWFCHLKHSQGLHS